MMKPQEKRFRWPVDKAIYLIERYYDVDALFPVDRNKIMVECNCSVPTLNRAIKAVRVKRILIQANISVTDPEFERYDKIYILKSAIDTLKDHLRYDHMVNEKLSRDVGLLLEGKAPEFKPGEYDRLRMREIERVLGIREGKK